MSRAVIVLVLLAAIIQISRAATYEVIVGKDDGNGFVAMQFFPQVVSITAGDSVRFSVQGDGHTVVFYKELVDYVDFPTLVILPSGRVQGDGAVVSTDVMYSSGLLLQGQSYTFTFPVAGNFPYHCSLHTYMVGEIRVFNTPVPRDPLSVSEEAQVLYQQSLSVVPNIVRDAKLELYRTNHPTRAVDGQPAATEHSVLVGAGDATNLISYMRFTPENLTIEVGDSIFFDVIDPVDVHTIAFNVSGEFNDEDLVAPDGTVVANGFYFRPFGNPYVYFENFLSAGLLAAPNLDIPVAANYTVRFVKPGVYPYLCNLHKDMGMRGVITVLPKQQKIKRTAGIVIWSILGGLFVLGLIALVLFLIIRALLTEDDD